MSEELSYKIHIDQSDLEMQLQAIQSAASTALNALFTPINVITDKLTNTISALSTLGSRGAFPQVPTSYNAAISGAVSSIQSPTVGPQYAYQQERFPESELAPSVYGSILEDIFPRTTHAVESIIQKGASILTFGHWVPFRPAWEKAPVWMPPSRAEEIYEDNKQLVDFTKEQIYSNAGNIFTQGLIKQAGMLTSWFHPVFGTATMAGFGMSLLGSGLEWIGLQTLGRGAKFIGEGLTQFGAIPEYLAEGINYALFPQVNISDYTQLGSVIRQLSQSMGRGMGGTSLTGRGISPLDAVGRAMDLEKALRDALYEISGNYRDASKWMKYMPTLVASGVINPFENIDKLKTEFKKLIGDRISKTMMALHVGEKEALQAIINWKQMGISGDAELDTILTGALTTAEITGLAPQQLVQRAAGMARSLLGTGMDLSLAPQGLYTGVQLAYGGVVHGVDPWALKHIGGPSGLAQQLSNLTINIRKNPAFVRTVAGLLNEKMEISNKLVEDFKMGKIGIDELINRGSRNLNDINRRSIFAIRYPQIVSKLGSTTVLEMMSTLLKKELKMYGLEDANLETKALVLSSMTGLDPKASLVVAKMIEEDSFEKINILQREAQQRIEDDKVQVRAHQAVLNEKRKAWYTKIKDWMLEAAEYYTGTDSEREKLRKRIHDKVKETYMHALHDKNLIRNIIYGNEDLMMDQYRGNMADKVLQMREYKERFKSFVRNQRFNLYKVGNKGERIVASQLKTILHSGDNLRKYRIAGTVGFHRGKISEALNLGLTDEEIGALLKDKDTNMLGMKLKHIQEVLDNIREGYEKGKIYDPEAVIATINNLMKEYDYITYQLETGDWIVNDDTYKAANIVVNKLKKHRTAIINAESNMKELAAINAALATDNYQLDQPALRVGSSWGQAVERYNETYHTNLDITKTEDFNKFLDAISRSDVRSKIGVSNKEYYAMLGKFGGDVGLSKKLLDKYRTSYEDSLTKLIIRWKKDRESEEETLKRIGDIMQGIGDENLKLIRQKMRSGETLTQIAREINIFNEDEGKKIGLYDYLTTHGLNLNVLPYWFDYTEAKEKYMTRVKEQELVKKISIYEPHIAEKLKGKMFSSLSFSMVNEQFLNTLEHGTIREQAIAKKLRLLYDIKERYKNLPEQERLKAIKAEIMNNDIFYSVRSMIGSRLQAAQSSSETLDLMMRVITLESVNMEEATDVRTLQNHLKNVITTTTDGGSAVKVVIANEKIKTENETQKNTTQGDVTVDYMRHSYVK